METVDNNQFEVIPSSKTKRKIVTPCSTAYLNPALDLLANEDPMCNTAMEIVPKKRKRTKSCEIVTFENTALDVGVSKAAVNQFLAKELENVRKNIKSYDYLTDSKENVPPPLKRDEPSTMESEEPIYANLTDYSNLLTIADNAVVPYRDSQDTDMSVFQPDVSEIEMDSGISVLEQKSVNTVTQTDIQNDFNTTVNTTNIQTNVTNQIFINNSSNLNLSFIDRLALDSPSLSNQSLYLDDDLNESNIMEIKTITIITKKKRIPEKKKITNPFLDPNLKVDYPIGDQNPFLIQEDKELEYNDEMLNNPMNAPAPLHSNLMPRKLFASDTNSTISTMNESVNVDQNEYENIDSYRAESPIYENVSGDFIDTNYNKQSKILGCDVSNFSAVDIMNLNKNKHEPNCSSDSNENKKHFKHNILRASNKLSKKVFKTLKKTFKGEKVEHNATLNPYEVPRKPPKQKIEQKDSGIENPALNLDNSDEIEIEEIEDDDDIEHQYETIKTIRNTRLNMNVTPLKEKAVDNADISHNRTNTPGKKVRFDSTLNQEKVITGNSFDYGLQSPGFDAKIDKYHDELENCINERKILQQNM